MSPCTQNIIYLLVFGLSSELEVGDIVEDVRHVVHRGRIPAQRNGVPGDALDADFRHICGVQGQRFDLAVMEVKIPHPEVVLGSEFDEVRSVGSETGHDEARGILGNFGPRVVDPGATSGLAVLKSTFKMEDTVIQRYVLMVLR